MNDLRNADLTATAKPIIKPTIGRVVHYWPMNHERAHGHSQPFVAFITHVWGDHTINVAGFNDKGEHFSRNSVTLAQNRDANDGECGWMPYQLGQAQHQQVVTAFIPVGGQP